MQRRPVAKSRQTTIASADLEDMEGGGSSVSGSAAGGSPYMVRQGSTASYGSASNNNDGIDLSMNGPSSPMFSYDDDSQKKTRDPRNNNKSSLLAYANYLTKVSSDNLRTYALVLVGVTFVLFFLSSTTWSILLLVTSACMFGAMASLWLSRAVLSCDDGTPEMRAVSDPIREGAEGFLKVQYTAIAKIAVPLAVLIVFSYQFRPHLEGRDGVAVLSNTALGFVAAMGFIFGAVCSAVSGYVSMWVAAQSNIRVASAGRRTYGEALVVCFQGGAFSAVLNLTLCITGVTSLYITMHFMFVQFGTGFSTTDIPMLLVGYGFGASFVALFMQLG